MIKILVVLDKFNSYIREFGIVKKHLFLSTVHFLECECQYETFRSMGIQLAIVLMLEETTIEFQSNIKLA